PTPQNFNHHTTNQHKFYTTQIQPQTIILPPSHPPQSLQHPNPLSNQLHKIHKTKHPQLPTQLNIPFPTQLSNHLQKQLLPQYLQHQFLNNPIIPHI
uniref:MobA/MobL family protein n=1 Tax=Cytobacillus oceanisediminis TaxID=665099 RepID=UPI0016424E79